MAIPVCIERAESTSAKIRKDWAIPVVATPLSVTVIPPDTNVNTEDAMGARLPGLGVMRTTPVRTDEPELELAIFTAERGAIE
jgi:hypothetical protein